MGYDRSAPDYTKSSQNEGWPQRIRTEFLLLVYSTKCVRVVVNHCYRYFQVIDEDVQNMCSAHIMMGEATRDIEILSNISIKCSMDERPSRETRSSQYLHRFLLIFRTERRPSHRPTAILWNIAHVHWFPKTYTCHSVIKQQFKIGQSQWLGSQLYRQRMPRGILLSSGSICMFIYLLSM